MDSPPPTPPSKPPTDGQWRFKTINTPCEWIEDYRPGGYHPTHLGDTFNAGRYKVIRKLGNGSYSTVWLARDLKSDGYVALKILVGNLENSNELQMSRHISKSDPIQSARHVAQLLDYFEHHGPNGLHRCLVFEPLGPTVNTMVEQLPQFKPRRRDMKIRYPLAMAKTILRQSLLALIFLHEQKIAHGDFQAGNILFAIDRISTKPESLLRQGEDAQNFSVNVERHDGKRDRWAPRYLCVAQPLVSFAQPTGAFELKLSDLGGAFFFGNPPEQSIVPTGLRTPELILTGEINETIDIWCFGCLIFELVTGQPLFCVPWSDSETDQDDDHLLSLTASIGALPNNLFREWKTSSLYFTPDRHLFNCELGGVRDGAKPLIIESKSMEQLFDEACPEVDDQEACLIKGLIRGILKYDPAERLSPKEILEHPWFSGNDKSQNAA